jgi:hypothetical protein
MSATELPPTDEQALRTLAIERIKRKRDYLSLLAVYIVINLLLIFIWLIATNHGTFWPIWSMIGGAVLLGYNGWQIYFVKPITEHEIADELRRIS